MTVPRYPVLLTREEIARIALLMTRHYTSHVTDGGLTESQALDAAVARALVPITEGDGPKQSTADERTTDHA